jgi:uncharacterized membrane protein YfcA
MIFLASNLLSAFAENWLILLVFFCIAILYSSVGFGGGSSYLATLSFTTLPFVEIRTIALICNIMVVSGNSWLYIKNHLFNWKKLFPIVALSIPMAFIGGILKIEQHVFYILLANTLIITGILTWFSKLFNGQYYKYNSTSTNLIIGAIIGFFSGLVGVGGGIFLAPILYLTKWDTPKRIAVASSFFILVNSVSGLIGQIKNKQFEMDYELTFLLALSVFIGGQIGSRLTLNFIKPILLKKMTATLIIFVGLKILFQHIN